MICKNCGSEMQDGAVFCPRCGAAAGSIPQWGGGPVGGTSGYTGPEAPVPGGGKKKGLLIGGAVALVAVIAAAAVMVSGMFSSPRKQLEKALDNTFAAYAKAEAALGAPDLNQLVQNRSYSQRLSLTLNQITSQFTPYDLSALEGLGFRMSGGMDWDSRELDIELAAFWDSQDIISLQIAAEDNELYCASPELTEGAFYGVNTETLGADLSALGAEDIGDVSFNLFDLMDAVLLANQPDKMEQSMKEACAALWEASRVERQGKETIQVNQNQVKAQAYQVVIPQSAVENFADALGEIMSSADYGTFYEQMLQASGLPQSEIDVIMGQLWETDPYAELNDRLKEAAAALGDVRLTVYVGGGYVSAVRYDSRIQGVTVKADLQLGGGKEYVDDLRLEVEIDGQRIVVDSTGDHGLTSGVFTDETTVRGPFPTITSELRYDPKGRENNLSWTLNLAAAGSLDMEGTLVYGRDSVDLRLDDMSFTMLGVKICSLGMDYYLGPWEGSGDRSGAKLISEMNGFELMALMVKTEANARQWLNQTQQMFLDRLPPELLAEMFY